MIEQLSMKTDVRIEVFDDHILLVFPRQVDSFKTPWQEAWILGNTIELAAEDIPNKPLIVNPTAAEFESSKMQLFKDGSCVVLGFEHTDRIKLGYEAARICGRAIKLYAQDLDFASRGTHIRYDTKGRIGRPTPYWEITKRTFGLGQSE